MERTSPFRDKYYHPLENPRRYPLELAYKDGTLAICLWAGDGTFKWTIASWRKDGEGYYLEFCQSRPLAPRVDWKDFRDVILIGQTIADRLFRIEEVCDWPVPLESW